MAEVVVARRRLASRWRSEARRTGGWGGLLYVLPAIALLVLFDVWPIIFSVWISLWKWDVRAIDFVGIDNYRRLFGEGFVDRNYNDDLVASVWVGFDDFSSLGRSNGVGEFGAQAALPIWMDYMGTALRGAPTHMLSMPPGISTITIDRSSGLPAQPGDGNTMSEMFKVEDLDKLRSQAAQQQQEQDKQHAYDIF